MCVWETLDSTRRLSVGLQAAFRLQSVFCAARADSVSKCDGEKRRSKKNKKIKRIHEVGRREIAYCFGSKRVVDCAIGGGARDTEREVGEFGG